MKLYQNLERIQRIDQLIRLEATGRPKRLAENLGISERQVYRLIDQMRFLGAEILYSIDKESYVYETPLKFNFGFTPFKVGEEILN